MLSAFSQKELSDGCLTVTAVNSGNWELRERGM